MKGIVSWTYILIFYCFSLTCASIAGVTYMDNFDFEERYRDINECNPLYWHPLHLPEKCLKIFEKVLRSNVASYSPYRLVKETQGLSEFDDAADFLNNPGYSSEFAQQTLSPFELLFELLRRDIQELPSSPTFQVSPYIGMMAVYKQPVSYKTIAMINKLGKAYG